MFRKLVSNLAYSPALIGQLGFYAKRLKKEEATRRLGLIFTALALVVQSFAVFSPPESANASSPNDMIHGGVTSVSEYLRHYDANTNNIKDLFGHVGITRSDIAATKEASVSNQSIYSWGMTPRFSHTQGERAYTFTTPGGAEKTFYYRPLSLWDNGRDVKHKMFIGQTKGGMWFGLMLNCGNLALKVIPPKPICPVGTVGIYPDCAVPPKMCAVPGKEKLPADSPLCVPDPVAACKSLNISRLTGNRYQFTSYAAVQNGAIVTDYVYTIYRDGKVIDTRSVASREHTNSYIYTQENTGDYKIVLTIKTSLGAITSDGCTKAFSISAPEVCPFNASLPKNSPECQPCPGDDSIWIKDAGCKADIVLSKTAHNTTQNNDATKVTADTSDKITYSLNVENKGLMPKTVTITEQLDDVLQYSTLINNGSGSISDEILTWPAFTLNPGEKQTRMLTVQVLDTIPTMPKGKSDGSSYDCKMTNTFGNTVEVDVSCPAEKVIVEQTVAELPRTGPRENMVFAGLVLATTAYFYARSRQIKKEVRLIRRDFNTGTI